MHTDTVRVSVMRRERGARSARLDVRAKAVRADVALPVQGEPLPQGLPPYPEPPPQSPLVLAGHILEALLGFIPVVGTGIDIAHLTYMAATGKTIWGDEVGEGDMLVFAGFALVGVVADYDDAVKLAGIGERLFPGAKLISLNPGLYQQLKARIAATCDPILIEVMSRVRGTQGKRLRDALDDYSRTGDTARVVDVFREIITKYDGVVAAGHVPDTLIQAALRNRHPIDLDAFPALERFEQERLLTLFREAVTDIAIPPKKVNGFLGALAGHAALHQQFTQTLQHWQVARLFNGSFDRPTLRMLSDGFHKARARSPHLNFVQWAAKLPPQSKYYAVLRAHLGPDFAEKLHQTEAYWTITSSGWQRLRQLQPQTMYVHLYSRLRSDVKGVGRWLQADHVMEGRFVSHHPMLAGYWVARGDIQAILVPRNEWVLEPLERAGFHFHYDHQRKTNLLCQLIPHGEEAAYNLPEIFAAHVLVMRHQLQLPEEVFRSLVYDEFVDVALFLGRRSDLKPRFDALMAMDYVDILRKYPRLLKR